MTNYAIRDIIRLAISLMIVKSLAPLSIWLWHIRCVELSLERKCETKSQFR